MKSIKKILSYLLVITIVMVCSTEGVMAADKPWPSYSSDTISKIGDYYCSYNMGNVFDVNTSSFEGGHYTNGIIYLTYYKGTIYFIHPGNKDFDAGKYMTGGSRWDKSGIDQHIEFDSGSLKSYLVDSNGNFSCKQLNFYETNGDLNILTPDEYSKHNVTDRTPAYSGSIMYKGENLTNKCSELAGQINSVVSSYQTDAKKSALDGLSQLANQSIYQLGDAQKAKGYYDSYMAIYNDSLTKFKDLDIATEDNNRKFNINQCDAVDSSISANYESLMESFQNDLADVQSYIARIIELNGRTEQNVRNSGNNEYADQIASERGVLDDSQKEITQIRREYKNFIDNANLGNLGDIVDADCEGILGEDLLEYIDKIFTWVKIAVPIILIVMGSLDFGKAVLNDDKDELRKATSRFVKRCIIAVAIFFIPSLLSYILHFFNAVTSTGGVSTCGIG